MDASTSFGSLRELADELVREGTCSVEGKEFSAYFTLEQQANGVARKSRVTLTTHAGLSEVRTEGEWFEWYAFHSDEFGEGDAVFAALCSLAFIGHRMADSGLLDLQR